MKRLYYERGELRTELRCNNKTSRVRCSETIFHTAMRLGWLNIQVSRGVEQCGDGEYLCGKGEDARYVSVKIVVRDDFQLRDSQMQVHRL